MSIIRKIAPWMEISLVLASSKGAIAGLGFGLSIAPFVEKLIEVVPMPETFDDSFVITDEGILTAASLVAGSIGLIIGLYARYAKNGESLNKKI